MATAKPNQVQLLVATWKQIQFLNMEEVWFEHRTKMTIEEKGMLWDHFRSVACGSRNEEHCSYGDSLTANDHR
jgi:hypothetical protein